MMPLSFSFETPSQVASCYKGLNTERSCLRNPDKEYLAKVLRMPQRMSMV